ncbi:hypothetical protein J6590_065049 [Homalodisca vitripennis]|nr:hypothetical protein J6590_065049 [Homalodisca vitripennis]
MSTSISVKLMDLPIEMIDKILSYFSYDQISKLRGVSINAYTLVLYDLAVFEGGEVSVASERVGEETSSPGKAQRHSDVRRDKALDVVHDVYETVAQPFVASPSKSTRKASAELEISRSVQRLLKQLKFKPYRPSLLQALHVDDSDRRWEFCETIIICSKADPNFFFKLHGRVNWHNCVYWSNVNPHNVIQAELNVPGVMPACSPDLTPCDFSLWGIIEETVYASKPQGITKDIQKSKINKGEIQVVHSDDVSITKWRDKRVMSLISTYHERTASRHITQLQISNVLDEAFKALRVVNQSINNTPNTSSNVNYLTLPRPHDFLQEYRDISSMAMEHFDDKILPSIREKMRLENPRLYCFKSRAVTNRLLPFLGRPPFLQPVKVPLSQDNAGAIIVGCSRLLPATKQNLENDGERAVTKAMPSMKLFRMLHHTKAKCNSTHRDVLTLQRTTKSVLHKIKCQNVLVKQRLNAQKMMLKHMKRELRDTRNAMNVMSKELNRLKFEQTSSGVSASEERSSTDEHNLPVALPTLCIPFINSKASTETKGVKRKRDSSNEITTKDAFCKLLCNKCMQDCTQLWKTLE